MGQAHLVVGIPRSGTSCVAGMLHNLGIPMGTAFPPPNAWNPLGNFEDQGLVELLTDSSTIGDMKSAAAYVAHRDGQSKAWGVKNPGLCNCLAAFAGLCQGKPKIITTTRPLADSCASYAARSGMDLASCTAELTQWAVWLKAALAAWRGPLLTVDFPTLISDPKTGVAAIAAFAGVPVTPAAVNFVNPALMRITGDA